MLSYSQKDKMIGSLINPSGLLLVVSLPVFTCSTNFSFMGEGEVRIINIKNLDVRIIIFSQFQFYG